MFSLGSSHRYYLYGEPTDMRKSFDGLAGLVRSKLHLPLTTGQVFVFINKRRDRVKLLHWEAGGFVLYYKRLEQGVLERPRAGRENCPDQLAAVGNDGRRDPAGGPSKRDPLCG